MSAAVALLGVLYTLAGVFFAVRLHGRGHGLPVSGASLLAWPLFVPLLTEGPRPSRGPLADRIEQTFDQLRGALQDPAATVVRADLDLTAVQEALHAMDRRLAFVDGLISDSEATETQARLTAARMETVSAIEGLLKEIHDLRLLVGLLALEGEPEVIRVRWQGLVERLQ
ncbi:MAG: hypothetical protein AAGA48_05260 [Myxococcota bacterium]